MSLLFACPSCKTYRHHQEPVGMKTNVRACPECRKIFRLWWISKEGRTFAVEPVMTGIMLGYPRTPKTGFATGGFTSDKAWSDESENSGEFFFGKQSPFFTQFDPNGPRYEQKATFTFDTDNATADTVKMFMEALRKARFTR